MYLWRHITRWNYAVQYQLMYFFLILCHLSNVYHLYADDTQVYIKLTSVNASTVIPELQSCLIAIQKWMAGYQLKLNPDKTEFIVFDPKNKRDCVLKFFSIDILGNKIFPTD